jgi:hypothetical protein
MMMAMIMKKRQLVRKILSGKVIQITNDRGNNLGADMELRCSKGDSGNS